MTGAAFSSLRLRGAAADGGTRTLLAVLIGALSATAQAQGAGAVPASPAAAQSALADTPRGEDEKAGRRAWKITPRLTVGETFTDNALLTNANKHSDWITEISPGLRVSGESARLKAYFDYTLREMIYARDSGRQNHRNALNTFGTFNAVENLFFIDFSAGIDQQAISAFGTQSPGANLSNANETETRTARLSPYLKGHLGGLANYELRYTVIRMRTATERASGMDQNEWQLHVDGATPYALLQWAVDASQQNYDYTLGRDSEAASARLKLTYLVDAGLKLSVMGGREENDFTTLHKESHNTSGFGIEWTPSARTRLYFERERRFFGNAHRFNFTHRTPRTALSFSDVRSVTASPGNMQGTASPGNLYDLLFNQMASVEPDPVQRDILVTKFLQANGLDPNSQATSGFLNSGPTVSRQQSLSFALLGVRNSLTLTATQGETQRLGLLSSLGEDLASGDAVRQRGFSIVLAHQFSMLSNLNLQASRQNSDSPSGLSSHTRNFTATVSHKLSLNTSVTLGARRVLFDNATMPYSETAFFGTLRMQY